MNSDIQSAAVSPPAGGQLLVVDDDALITATVASMLRQAGYTVAEATSAHRALELCASQLFDLAIVDERMPNMTGTQLALTLREKHGVPVAFLSAHGERELIESTSAVGALGFFVKPIDPQRMLPSVHNMLARARELRALRVRETQLQTALANEREINTAVGVLIERLGATRENAFEALRRYARSQRQQVAKIAAELLHSINDTQRLIAAIRAHNPMPHSLVAQNTDSDTRLRLKDKSDDSNQ